MDFFIEKMTHGTRVPCNTILELTKFEFFVNTKLEHNGLFFFFYGTRTYQARVPFNMELKLVSSSSLYFYFFDNQQIKINIKISNFFHLNAQTYVK